MTAVPERDPIGAFTDAIRCAGLEPPEQVTADGKLHRFPTNGKRGDDSGWYVLHGDGLPAGSFGCWRSGVNETWCAEAHREFTTEERRAYAKRMKSLRLAREAEERHRHADAAKRAAQIWSCAKQGDHVYLTRKEIKAHGVRVDNRGRLLVPLRDSRGNLCSLQFIAADGGKKFLSGGKVAGCYHSIGSPDGLLCIAEGYATAASIHEATGNAVAVAFNAGNLKPVALELRRKYACISLIICADNDPTTKGNPGMTKATDAAKAAGAAIAAPHFGDDEGTDFNDLHRLRGVRAVQEAIDSTPVPRSAQTLYRRLSDVRPEPINWLWQGRIARGKVSIIAGDPGLGKSQTTASMAAIVTTGGRWPVDRAMAEQGNVIILSAEDDAADTIRPRLDAAGADVSRVYVLDAIPEITNEGVTRRAFNLKTDLTNLENMVAHIGGAALLVIDPISAYLGSADSHKNAEVRALLAPLSEMAARLGIAIVGVSHLNKGGPGGALSRVTGSLAFVAAARAAYIVSKDPDDPGRRLFLPAKNNVGPDQTGLAFTVEGFDYDGIQTSRVMWEPDPVTMTADEAVIQHDPEERSERADAKEFLKAELRNGPKKQKAIEKAAADAGHSWATIRRAKKELKITSAKEGGDGPWSWELPSPKVLTFPRPQDVSTLSTLSSDAGSSGIFDPKVFTPRGEQVGRESTESGVQPTGETEEVTL